MKKCFILCNIENNDSNYIVSNFAGSNMSYYLGDLVSTFSYPVYINVGAPKKKWKHNKWYFCYKRKSFDIVEFSHGLAVLPNRFKAKIMLKKAMRYILSNKTESDLILIYHSPSFSKYYEKILSKFGTNNVVVHVAELYSDVGNISLSRKKEVDSLKPFSKYIFMSRGLKENVLGTDSTKKHKLIYGVYRTKENDSKQSDKKIHVVYSGTSSKIKGGLYNALEASKFLDDRFVLHIHCRADNDLENYIKSFNVEYGGYINEHELFEKLVNYNVGLSTQNPFLPFNESSFPSKIVNYLACGLNVVSSRTRSVVDSPFNDRVIYYEEGDIGKNIADSIILASRHMNKNENQRFISSLHQRAIHDIKDLFEEKL